MSTHPAVTTANAPRHQARNSAEFWAATARSRGHEVIWNRGYLAAVGDERAGTRILIQEPDLSEAEVAEIVELAKSAAGPADAEDPYSATDLSVLGWRNWQMPVMVRQPGPVATPALDVSRVSDAAELAEAEKAVITSFGLRRFEPHRAGELFPLAFVSEPGVGVHVARIDDTVAGAAVSVVADGLVSHYWVGTAEAFRSRGVGRAVMLGALAESAQLPATLTASKLGRPLYESLGYVVASPSTWWASV